MARKRISKHTTTLIKEELTSELRLCNLSVNDVWNLQHAAKLIKEREDRQRIPELVDLFLIAEVTEYIGIQEFYWWYKDHRITSEDSRLYQVFDKVSENFNLEQCSPNAFSGFGNKLVSRIKEWKGEADNSVDAIILEYFTGILPPAVEFNAALATAPKSLLSNYGWGLFEAYIRREYGGKLLYLDASVKDKALFKTEKPKLTAIQRIRDIALQNGDLKFYDDIGKLLTFKTIGETYEDLFGT